RGVTAVKRAVIIVIGKAIGDYLRDRQLTIYLEEADGETPAATLVLAKGKAAEKPITLLEGYQEIMFSDGDLPLAVKAQDESEVPLTVYVNGEVIAYDETDGYAFPEQLAENPVVKIYTESQPSISVEYEINAPAYEVVITHDRHTVVDNTKRHSVLPGTEISFRLNPRSVPKFYTLSRAAAEGPAVTVNDDDLTPDANGVYTLKVTREHATSGIHIAVNQGDNVPTGIDEVLGDKTAVDIYDLNGRTVMKGATREEIDRLPAGVYIVGGRKVLLDK
ncbi:MAG: T9SS type A sorting domain-containing protein, partial [Duncaniella sp.]|nr:T9SS type A sorting domain-containing protein [Duncaniella sp.]